MLAGDMRPSAGRTLFLSLALGAGFALGRMTAPAGRAVELRPRTLERSPAKSELADLRAAIETLSAGASVRSTPAPAAALGRTSLPADPRTDARQPGSPEWLAALERIESLVATEHERTRAAVQSGSSQASVLERVRNSKGVINWAAWQPILDLWHSDPDAARKELKLLSADRVLERFGPPTDIWTVSQGITWQYARDFDPVEESWGLEIILRVPDGYVTQLAVRGDA